MKKTDKQRTDERKIVYNWACENIKAGEKNIYYLSKDIYNKFLKNSKAYSITHKSFGLYLTYVLKKLNIEHIVLKKKNDKAYFGICVTNLESFIQYFDIAKYKLKYQNNLYEIEVTNFGFFNDRLIYDWILARLIVDEKLSSKEGPTITSLFHDYSKYYNFYLSPTAGLLSHFGKLLNKVLKQKYLYIANTTCRITDDGRIYPFLKFISK